MLAVSRSNAAKATNNADLYAVPAVRWPNSWQQNNGPQHRQQAPDNVALDNARCQAGMPQSKQQLQDRLNAAQQDKDRLLQQLTAVSKNMEYGRCEHLKLQQEHQLRFADLKQHTSIIESRLQETRSSAAELQGTNKLLDNELRWHKSCLNSAQQASGQYHNLFKQEEHEKARLAEQLQHIQAELANSCRDSNHMWCLAEKLPCPAAAASHEIHTEELSEARNSLKQSDLQHQEFRGALGETGQEQEGGQEESLKQQLSQQAKDNRQATAYLTDTVSQLESHLQYFKQHLDLVCQHRGQAQNDLNAQQAAHVEEQLQQAQTSFEAKITEQAAQHDDTVAHLNQSKQQLMEQLSSQDSQLVGMQHELVQACKHAEHSSDEKAQLQARNSQLEESIQVLEQRLQQAEQHHQQPQLLDSQAEPLQADMAALQEECMAKGAQIRQLLKIQEQFETSEAARQASGMDLGSIMNLIATNSSLEGQISSMARELQESQSKCQQAEESYHAQLVAASIADQELELNKEVCLSQEGCGWSHYSQLAGADVNTDASAGCPQVQQGVADSNLQLQQAQQQPQQAQHAQQADHASQTEPAIEPEAAAHPEEQLQQVPVSMEQHPGLSSSSACTA